MDNLTFPYEGKDLNIVLINGAPYWQANEICSILGFENPRDAIKRHVDPEDVVKHDTLSKGGFQKTTYLNESGLYALIFGSSLPDARKFKRWVTSEVLPSIRKTGTYSLVKQHILSAYVKEMGPYAPLFPPEYYYEIHRLMGWDYNPNCQDRPGYVGVLTNKLIYKNLPPGVLEQLKLKNPWQTKKGRDHKHHQFLTPEIGRKHLQKEIEFVVEMAKICSSMKMLEELCENRHHRLYGNPDDIQLKFLSIQYNLDPV